MNISDKYTLQFFINDDTNDLFKIPGAQIDSIDIYEDVYKGLPTFSCNLIIPKDYFNTQMFVDGTVFKIVLNSEEMGIEGKYTFRCWNITNITQLDDIVQVSLDGVLDVYPIYEDANKYNDFANTSDIFKKIATDLNVSKFDIDCTLDQQLWVAGRRNVFQFLHHLSKYGYINETSSMFWFFDKEKRLIYKDFSKLLKEKTVNVFKMQKRLIGDRANRIFGYVTESVEMTAGTDNIKNGGYGNDFDVFNLLTYSDEVIHANKVIAESKVINISKELSNGLNYDWFSFDVGNFHEHYYLAYAQNRRIKSTYSTYINLGFQYLQQFRLGEVVEVEYRNNGNSNNKSDTFSMLGFIGSIHTIITPDSVSAEVQVVSQGVNTKSDSVTNY